MTDKHIQIATKDLLQPAELDETSLSRVIHSIMGHDIDYAGIYHLREAYLEVAPPIVMH